jgi:hypothetical protein
MESMDYIGSTFSGVFFLGGQSVLGYFHKRELLGKI